MSDYQFFVIGAGPGGYVAALRAARLGLRTAIAERREVGGTCLNRGCIPTKSLLHSAALCAEIGDAARFGVRCGGAQVDLAAVYARKDAVIEKLRAGILQRFKAAGVDYLPGSAAIVGTGRVRVDTADGPREYTCDDLLVATGSVPARPPIPGLELPGVVTSDELLAQADRLYSSLVIIGGGVIGVELASFYAALGTQVTIVEALERILPTMDRELSQSMAMLLKKRGVVIHTGCRVERIERDGSALRVIYTEKESLQSAAAECVLCAIGRRPDCTGLLGAGVTLETERGRIVVDGRFRTSLPHVYAVGDVSSRVQLAHVASAQGAAVAEQLAGQTPSAALDVIPACIYTSPEIACVGLTADEAKKQGRAVRTGKCLMGANGRTVIAEGERGYIRLVADAETGALLGAQLMCERATDIISELTAAIVNGLTAAQLLRAVRPHPTFEEALTDALEMIK